MSDDAKLDPTERDAVARLVRLAGKRPGASPAATARARAAARAAWSRTVRRDTRRRAWLLAAGLAAAACLALLLIGRPGPDERRAVPAAAPAIATVEIASGTGRCGSVALAAGQPLTAAAEVLTGDDGRAAIRLDTGQVLALDHATAVRIEARGVLTLARGAIYVSRHGTGPALSVRTPLGTIRELGTRFEARLSGPALRLRLREGRVALDAANAEHQVSAGEELVVGEDGSTRRAPVEPWSDEWNWTATVTPLLELDGRRVLEFLEWIARERGLELVLEDAAARRIAAQTVLSGGGSRLTLEHALEAVLPACGLTHRVERERLVVRAGD